jgi:uncharacterized protein (DUF111 family)
MMMIPMPPSLPSTPADRCPTEVWEIAVNLDDVSGEIIGDAVPRLLEAGALDVWTTPIQMKKQRPGVMLGLLCASEQRDALARLVIELTGSFGVRFRPWERLVLQRRFVTLTTALGDVRVKVGALDGREVVAAPEYESVRQLAQRAGVSLRQAMLTAQAAVQQWHTGPLQRPSQSPPPPP